MSAALEVLAWVLGVRAGWSIGLGIVHLIVRMDR